jgi:CD2 antigen cytoplasmic tail-binding protein 2
MDVDTNPADDESNGTLDPAEIARRKAVDAITGSADALYSRQQHEIYDTEREMLMRQYHRETGGDWSPPIVESGEMHTHNGNDADGMWEYRWSDARDGGENHGPYDAATMKAWNEAGYFGEGVEFRHTGAANEDWSRVLDVR